MGILWNHMLKSKICTENKVETHYSNSQGLQELGLVLILD